MKRKPTPEPKIRVVETFHRIEGYEISRMEKSEPSCFNGVVSIRKYRVTVEALEESADVLFARLLVMWRKCDNMHHHGPLHDAATSIGRELPRDEYGVEAKRRY